jgi:arginase
VRVIEVPYFIGEPIGALQAPEPVEVLSVALPAGSAQARMGVLYRALADAVAAPGTTGGGRDGGLLVVYAGDCLATIGVHAGLQRSMPDPALVWFDAHGDFHTWETTGSGFLGGMPLAMLVGRGEQTIVQAAGLRPLPEARVALVGARDLDPDEDAAVAGSAMAVLDVADVGGWAPPDGPIHLHVDLDVIDPADMPAHNYAADGGPSAAAVTDALVALMSTGRAVAVSFSTWNPALPDADRAAAVTRGIVAALAGARPAMLPGPSIGAG